MAIRLTSLIGTVPENLLPVNIPAPPPAAPLAVPGGIVLTETFVPPPLPLFDFSPITTVGAGGGGSVGLNPSTDPFNPVLSNDPFNPIGGPVAIPVPLPGPSAPPGSVAFGSPAPGFTGPLPGPGFASSGLQFTPTPAQGTAGCNLLPPGAIRDACLFAAGFLPAGGSTSPITPSSGPVIPQRQTGGAPVAIAGAGLQTPTLRQITRMECPRFANGGKGILWMNISGQVVCLPRGVNGSGFGLFRKNAKRAKPFISAAQIKELKSVKRTQKKAKKFASLAGLVAHSKGAHRGR